MLRIFQFFSSKSLRKDFLNIHHLAWIYAIANDYVLQNMSCGVLKRHLIMYTLISMIVLVDTL